MIHGNITVLICNTWCFRAQPRKKKYVGRCITSILCFGTLTGSITIEERCSVFYEVNKYLLIEEYCTSVKPDLIKTFPYVVRTPGKVINRTNHASVYVRFILYKLKIVRLFPTVETAF